MIQNKIHILIVVFLLLGISCKNNRDKEKHPRNKEEVKKQMEDVNRILIKKDHEQIKGYAARHGWKMVETETGLWYEIITEGNGRQAAKGLLATINYSVSLMDGTLCYSSQKKGPKTFLIGQGNVESGLEQAILLLKEGSKARFILPPHLAYGLPGDGDKIPSRSIIIYEVELISLSN
jgi:FKBP-type peptidyl-prolyl cis-trans isomerase FkpA